MTSHYKEDIDRYFDFSCYAPKRYLYLGSLVPDTEDGESGTDCQMAEYFIKGLTYLESNGPGPITVYANNLGGDWYHGMAIYDAIRASTCHVSMIAFGYACSMGSIILQAADTRIIAPHCVFMIHDGTEGLEGHARKVESWAAQIPLLRKRMYEIYRERMKVKTPKITLLQIEKLCSFDKIFTAAETVEVGLADWVLETMGDIKYTATEAEKKWVGEAV